MLSLIRRPIDFIAFTLFFVIGFNDIFLQPQLAADTGLLPFLGIYSAILLLFGIPAFAEEISSCMVTEEGARTRSRVNRTWSLGYGAILIIQLMQVAVGSAFDIMETVAVQLFALFGEKDYGQLPLLNTLPACAKFSMGSNTTLGAELTSSCSELRLTCHIMKMLESNPNAFYYSSLVLSVILLVYVFAFGRSLNTYSTVGKLYMSLIVLFVTVQALHFISATTDFKKILSGQLATSQNLLQSNTVHRALDSCIYSLGLTSFGLVIIGSRAGRKVKTQFVSLTVAICLIDFGTSTTFAMVNTLRQSAVSDHCHESNATENTLRLTFTFSRSDKISTALRDNVLRLQESVRMFHETSGIIPWTVYLPIQTVLVLVSVLLMCDYFLLGDIQSMRVLPRWHWCTLTVSMLRFCLLVLAYLLKFTGYFGTLAAFMKISVNISFFLMKIAECVNIHLGQGFAELLRRKRSLISEGSSIQLFAYNWYIAPGIVYLFNFGYPLVFMIYVLTYKDHVITSEFLIYYLSTNLLPALIIMIVAYCLTTDEATTQTISN